MESLFFHIPTKVYFGQDSIERLGQIASVYGKRLLVLTDPVIWNHFGIRISTILASAGVEALLFQETGPGSNSVQVEKAVRFGRVSRVQGVIGFGGTRVLSMARTAAAMLSARDRPLDDVLTAIQVGGMPLPYIEVPSTCRYPFLLSNQTFFLDGRDRKTHVLNLYKGAPCAVVFDPVLATRLSSSYTGSTAIDAFLLIVEGLLSRKSTFLSDTLFLRASNLLLKSIRRSVAEPDNRAFRVPAARAGLLIGMGMTMSTPGLGTVIAAVIAGHLQISRSLAACILLPHILEFGVQAQPGKIERLSAMLRERDDELSPVEATEQILGVVRSMINSLDLPLRLRDLGLRADQLSVLTSETQACELIATVPGNLDTENILAILKQAY